MYPPVDTAFYHPDGTAPRDCALVVSALVPYKRIDRAIEACGLAGMPLKIVGSGPERASLERLATSAVEFLGNLSDEEIRSLYRRAAVVLMPGEEDFGIVPLEAQACGCPVVALGRGGALETVVDGVTGLLVRDEAPAAMAEALTSLPARHFDPVAIRQHALAFGRDRFAGEIRAAIEATL